MSKILPATCSDSGIVTVDGVTVDAEILSLGSKSSTGILVIDDDRATYVASSAADVKQVIEDLSSILQKIILIVTGLDAVTVSPGTQAANVALLTTLKTQFELTKDRLK